MKVLVTGGAGFIGSNLVQYLQEEHPRADVVILDDLSTGRIENVNHVDAELVQASILDSDAVERAMRGADAVVHLAALGSVPRSVEHPIASHHANVTGTLNVLEAARKNDAHVLYASSSSVYGANAKLPKSELDWTRPMSPYAASKLAAEAYVLAYQATYGLPALSFRLFNVYGPRQRADHVYAAVVPRFIDAALTGKPLLVHGDGLQARDFTYVRTVCQVLDAALSHHTTAPDPVNLAYGTTTTLLDLIGLISTRIGAPVRVEHVEARPGDVRASQSDGVTVRQMFPQVEPVPLDTGIERTIEWLARR